MILPESSSTPRSGGASAAPRPAAGTRARGGNAMARTRRSVLAGALRAVEQSGARRSTMTDVAVLGGVAKATVYNHFRTKSDVLAALVESEVEALGEECAQRASAAQGRDGLAAALEHAAARLSEHGALRRLAADEPDALARLLVPGDAHAWVAARESAGRVLQAAGRAPDGPAVELVLRFVASHLAWPTTRPAAAAAADALALGIPLAGDGSAAGAPSASAPDAGVPGAAAAAGTGLGWPG